VLKLESFGKIKMNDFLKIFKWFERNIFKLIFALIGLVVLYAIILFLIPIFQFVGFVSDGVNEVQNIFQEMEKHIEEFKWKKELPSTPKDESSV
tara:strand:+ start:143 stop:424 length:282 start_codon:yes stop_codon:yes gene_type:complete